MIVPFHCCFIQNSDCDGVQLRSNWKMTGGTNHPIDQKIFSEDLFRNSSRPCDLYNRSARWLSSLGENYGGIPVALLFYVGIWLLLLLVFLIMRKNLFNVIRRGLKLNISRMKVLISRYSDGQTDPEAGSGAVQPDLATIAREESGFLSWLTTSLNCYFYSEQTMLQLAGPDAVQYLRFQTFLIAFIALLTLLSISVILPINYQGGKFNQTEFNRTTIANLEPSSPFLYVHIILAFLLYPISIILMKKFSVDLKLKDSGLVLSRTLLIRNIPRAFATEELIRKHFSEAYPHLNIIDVSMAYEVTDLTKRLWELENARDARRLGLHHLEVDGEPLMMYPRPCSRFSGLCCSCCSEKVRQELKCSVIILDCDAG